MSVGIQPAITQTTANKVFISWSGDNSKAIARKLKEALEEHIFFGSNLECFVSDVCIPGGEAWYNHIKEQLASCGIGIAVVTKENTSAPWLFFEAGAIVAREIKCIPLLVNCKHSQLNGTPFSGRQQKSLDNPEHFKDIVYQINEKFGRLQPNTEALDSLIDKAYAWLQDQIAPTIKQLDSMLVFSRRYVYPKNIEAVTKDSIFVTAPMSAFEKEEDYNEIQAFVASLEEDLKKIGYVKVISPLPNNKWGEFQGEAAAIEENYPALKAAEAILIILPKNTCYNKVSSIWIDIGYCLALTKKMVIFHEDELPYMLKAAGMYINHVHTLPYKYDSTGDKPYESIRNIITHSGKALFGTIDTPEASE